LNFKNEYDLVVVGGGPAGTVSAWTAVELGVNTLLLEKDRDFGIPVRCAEGAGLKGLLNFLPNNPKWVDNYLEQVRFHAPDGTPVSINLGDKGVILNRKVFDFELALRAAEAGAEVHNRCYVSAMTKKNGKWLLEFESYGHRFQVLAAVVIGADGVESRVGRWAGLKTNLPLKDTETCFQYLLQHRDIEKDYCDFYFGNEIAPGGYIWVFPKGEHYANVGMGIAGDYAKRRAVKDYLDDFISRKFPGASYLSSVAGSVPSAKVPKNIVAEGVMLVGDSAHQADPISGGGILPALWAGRFAGQTAAKALEKGDLSPKFLQQYHKVWDDKIGDTYRRYYRLKLGVRKLTDDMLNRTAKVLMKIPQEERTLRKIFQTALINEPGLMIDIVKAFI
jgi:digeranylgeranylglycerophospholipid reductase